LWLSIFHQQHIKGALMITEDGTIIIKRNFNCTPEVLWQAWMDPKQLLSWWENMENAEMNPTPGGQRSWYYKTSKGPLEQSGQYVELVENKKFSFTWDTKGACSPGVESQPETLVTIELNPVTEAVTELVLTHKSIATNEIRLNHVEGWTQAFDWLEKSL
jgi:uncharacterized protein YndB with AHSA1/START domain